jgi:hypothetical protein
MSAFSVSSPIDYYLSIFDRSKYAAQANCKEVFLLLQSLQQGITYIHGWHAAAHGRSR